MVALPCTLFQVTIGLDYFFVISIVDNMASQNSKDWEFLLAHVSDYPIQHLDGVCDNEAETSKRRIQLHLDLDPQQLPLTSLKRLQLDVRVLVIILKVEAMLIRGH
jgi:hypothetical protein